MKKYVLRCITDSRLEWFVDGLREGLSAPVVVYTAADYCLPRSTTDGMRSDWERIGNDFRAAIGRGHEQEEQESRQVA